MNAKGDIGDAMNDELKTWVRNQMDAALNRLNEQQVFDDSFVESKPAWVLPMQILVGTAREQNAPQSARWFVCGDVPLDHIDSGVAATPRDALRHFAMKWQLDADRLDEAAAVILIDKAEFLYDLTEDDRLWSA